MHKWLIINIYNVPCQNLNIVESVEKVWNNSTKSWGITRFQSVEQGKRFCEIDCFA